MCRAVPTRIMTVEDRTDFRRMLTLKPTARFGVGASGKIVEIDIRAGPEHLGSVTGRQSP